MRIFYTENKQTGQLIFLSFGHFDQKTEKNGMNRTLIANSKRILGLTYFEQIGWKQKLCEFIKPFREELILKVKE